ncbi:glycosyltransferase [Micromonospora mirobrigensis]|uniref:Glycosyltransferase involved in cell wall bisynthesis n=1 Tax=Micromonospora mirobrigensis TaxID=262898 RepID=A0A1C4Z9G0_9ACTN|nr:glycosyltransferase [Micromonospora mirobrigensis]SCF29570.1 Glycosyltransferase involved in cell wall bisynthesis [Micromonospora mirobrigensis]
MRIALLLKTNEGGLWVVPQLEELRRRGHEVLAILPPGDGRLTRELRQRGFPVLPSPFSFGFAPRWATIRGLLRLRRLLRGVRPDVVLYHLYASALAARLTTLGRRLRRVHMVAGPLYLESPLIRRAERALWRLDTVTVCGARFTSEFYGRLGCPPARRPVVPYGTDTDRFAPPPDRDHRERQAKARAELGLPPAAFVVIMVAYVYPPRRLVHQGIGIKGHDVLLAAWGQFSAQRPDAHLLLVGAGWGEAGEAHRHALLDRFRVAENPSVSWLTSVSDVRPCYLAADLSVAPSMSENHGSALEAGAMGVPSIVSDAGGLPETVDAHSGWVVPRGDVPALLSALLLAHAEWSSGALAERARRSRRRVVERFDSRDAAVALADVIEAAVTPEPARPAVRP